MALLRCCKAMHIASSHNAHNKHQIHYERIDFGLRRFSFHAFFRFVKGICDNLCLETSCLQRPKSPVDSHRVLILPAELGLSRDVLNAYNVSTQFTF